MLRELDLLDKVSVVIFILVTPLMVGFSSYKDTVRNTKPIQTTGIINDNFSSKKSIADRITQRTILYPSVMNEERTPISISGNDEFSTQANSEGWPGDGSEENPIVIDGLIITTQNEALIYIQNTTVHFRISNCLLTDGTHGIYLYSVINGYLVNNTVINSSDHGILLRYSENNTLVDNKVIDGNVSGFNLQHSNLNNLTANEASNNILEGIYLAYSGRNILIKNRIIKNGLYGIAIWRSQENIIIDNEVINNNTHGIYVLQSENCTFLHNTIANNDVNGVDLSESHNNNFSLNTVEYNSNAGFNLLSSHNNTFFSNVISHQLKYGIQIVTELSMNNKITWNNFINNSFGSSSPQALDNGIANLFSHNYWSEWTTPDENKDTIVDIPYAINGTANNQDLSPLVTPYSPSTTSNRSELFIERIIIFCVILSVFVILVIYQRTKKA
jgi:parallel beta-helix repeat protein